MYVFLQSHVAVLLGQTGSTLGAQQLEGGHDACAGVGSLAGHVGRTGGHSSVRATHFGDVGSSLGLGSGDDVVGSVDLVLVQHGDGSGRLESADGAALDSDLQVSSGQCGVDGADSLTGDESHLGGGSVGIGSSQTGSLADAAGDVIGSAGNEALGVHDGQHGDAECVAQADKTGSLGHAVVAQLLAGGHDAHGVAADGSEGGVDVLAETGVHLHGAVLIDEGSSSLCRLGVGAQDSGGLLELEDGRAGQVVGRQQTHDVGSLLSSLGSVSGHE